MSNFFFEKKNNNYNSNNNNSYNYEYKTRDFSKFPPIQTKKDTLLTNYLNENSEKYHPQIGSSMANHFSMAIQSLKELGGNEERMKEWYEENKWHRNKNGPEPKISSDLEMTDDNWTQYLGRREFFHAFKRFFLAKGKKVGREELIHQIAPPLFPGQWKGLYHPIIRVYFGLLHEDLVHVVDGLSYWAIRYETFCNGLENISSPEQKSIRTSTQEIISEVQIGHGNTFTIVENLCNDLNFRKTALSKIKITSENWKEILGELCELSCILYFHTPALTTLHGTTGIQALSDILPFVDDKIIPIKYIWIWLSALSVEKRISVEDLKKKEFPRKKDDNWTKISKDASQSSHTHVLKMTYTLRTLSERYPQYDIFMSTARFMVDMGRPW